MLSGKKQTETRILPPAPEQAVPPAPDVPDAAALSSLEAAAAADDCTALVQLGTLYEKGLGVTQDYEQAAMLYRRAAELGDVDGNFRIGVCHITGEGAEKNLELASPYLIYASEHGHAKAMNLLALDYSLGGDGKEAFTWYDRAARAGVIRSQISLGDLYRSGYNGVVSPSIRSAVYWYCRAYLQGSSDARDRLNHLITTPREFRSGIEPIEAMLEGIRNGTEQPPEVHFIEKKRRLMKRGKKE